MRDCVAQAHLLIGATLRDPERQREGRVVGVDQTREAPALWILWVEGAGAERVVMSHRELAALAAGCTGGGAPPASLRGGRTRRAGGNHESEKNEKKKGVEPPVGSGEAEGGMPRRRASGERGGE
ncbi:hypothetical protein KGQ90_15695 [Modicisalibacter tunisiensis]|uniref:hypothetical protein n=1 Tax=Modicisalibacter tunisiensis TaxID=390637 RepID=UPI001CCE2BBE|nr:hypothetical protein [Modicisalibacter tunisiensis]MBZ9540362.1 hypothetical protein [Modicisalibacter tunisiensis]